jgi:DNA-binding beta-propeller fold protein YncE
MPNFLSRSRLIVGTSVLVLLVVVAIVVVIAVGGSKPTVTVSTTKPLSVVAGPAGIVSGSTPDPSGRSWVLVNVNGKANLQAIDVSSGKITGAVPLSSQARIVTVAAGGEIGVGIRQANTGAVQFYSGQGFNPLGTVALSGPVEDLVAGSNGTSFYALVDVKGAYSVSVINAKSLHVTGIIPMPSTTLSIAVSPDLTTIYSLQANGDVQIVDAQTGKVIQALPSAAGGRQIVLSADGATLYVLKGSMADDNVSVINIATQSTVSVLPAPSDTSWIEPSLDGTRLIDFVGTSKIGNVQTFLTHR